MAHIQVVVSEGNIGEAGVRSLCADTLLSHYCTCSGSVFMSLMT